MKKSYAFLLIIAAILVALALAPLSGASLQDLPHKPEPRSSDL